MIGKIISWTLLLIAFLLSIPAASHTGLTTWISISAASMAFVAMAQNLFLATRSKYIESWFGGLDRIYEHHRHLGIAVAVLVGIHFVLTPNFKGKILTSGLNDAARITAEYAVWILAFLLVISLIQKMPFTHFKLPYEIWRQSHRFMGIIFCLIAFHQMFIKRPFDGNALLAQYLIFFAFIGIGSFFFTQFAPYLRRKNYVVKTIKRLKNATIIDAVPKQYGIKSKPGQFAFLRFNKSGLNEAHPFTIVDNDENGIRFAIKPLGDFTSKLRDNLEIGDTMQVEGGYGRFLLDESSEHQIWLAGGIGITPFLAMVENLTSQMNTKVVLVHCVRNNDEAINFDILEKMADQLENFEFILFESEVSGRIDIDKLDKLIWFDLNGSKFYFCGPTALRKTIQQGMVERGDKFSKTIYEKFELR